MGGENSDSLWSSLILTLAFWTKDAVFLAHFRVLVIWRTILANHTTPILVVERVGVSMDSDVPVAEEHDDANLKKKYKSQNTNNYL